MACRKRDVLGWNPSYCRSWDPPNNWRFRLILGYTPLSMVYTCWLSNLNCKGPLLCLTDLLSPIRNWYWWTPLVYLPWRCLPWIWVTWYKLPWMGLPWNWITYGSWGCIWSMSKVFLSCITRPLFLLNWYFGVSLGILVPSGLKSWWI